ncbi:MAG: response regulator [bacterium]
MLHRSFNVLLVDDEPDVLAVSKLAIRRMQLYGLPIRVLTAGGRREALELLRTHPEGSNIALAIIDVVMETEHAGLELCGDIRGALDNQVMPLIIRTGQAGKAPEREVIDRYEITGYINKVEATEGRLYSLIKGAIRQYAMTAYDYHAGQLLFHLITNLRSPARARKAVEACLDALGRSPAGVLLDSVHHSHCVVGPRFYAGSGTLADAMRGRGLRDQLALTPPTPVSRTGDRIHVTDEHLLVHVEGTADHPTPLQSVWTIAAPPPPFVQKALYMATRQMQVLLNLMER